VLNLQYAYIVMASGCGVTCYVSARKLRHPPVLGLLLGLVHKGTRIPVLDGVESAHFLWGYSHSLAPERKNATADEARETGRAFQNCGLF
jgi:hypothetical protein